MQNLKIQDIFLYAYEIKLRLFYILFSFIFTFVCCYLIINNIIYVSLYPILDKMSSQRFIFNNITELFFIYLNFTFKITLILTLCVSIFQFFSFISNGLYLYEFKLLSSFFILSCIFSTLIGFLCYKILIPKIWLFFLNLESVNILFPIHFEARLKDYLSFFMKLILNFLLIIQIPIIGMLLINFNYLTNYDLIIKRKLFYTFIFFIGTIISPPDVFSQLILISFLLGCYELIVFYFFLNKNL